MHEHDKGVLIATPPATCATNATQTLSFATPGYGRAIVDILVGTHATNGAAIGTLKFSESDTVTSPSSMTDIAALTGGTATSTSVGFVIPGASALGAGAVLEFQIDLRKRKKYLGLSITPGTTTMNIGVITRLCEETHDSAESATEKSAVTNYALTSATNCALVVNA